MVLRSAVCPRHDAYLFLNVQTAVPYRLERRHALALGLTSSRSVSALMVI